jgi:hypothetical protein
VAETLKALPDQWQHEGQHDLSGCEILRCVCVVRQTDCHRICESTCAHTNTRARCACA